MIAELNRLIDVIDDDLSEDLDVASLARESGVTEYHLRRMFSSLVGMPLSEYVRRRRMTVAAAAVVAGDPLLDIAPAEVRVSGGPLRTQPKLRLRLTVEGNTTMDTRIAERPAFRLVGHAARVPLINEGINPHIQTYIAALPESEHARLKGLSSTEPSGLLQVSDGVDPDYREGTELTYLHGVALDAEAPVPDDLDVIEVEAGEWASGPYPAALQEAYAASASDWFPANPWQLRPGPSIVAVLERADDFSTATTELWMPIARRS